MKDDRYEAFVAQSRGLSDAIRHLDRINDAFERAASESRSAYWLTCAASAAFNESDNVEVRGAYHREIAGFQARNATTERIGGQLEEAIRDVRRQLKRTREAYNCWIGTSWSRDSNPWHDPKTRGE